MGQKVRISKNNAKRYATKNKSSSKKSGAIKNRRVRRKRK